MEKTTAADVTISELATELIAADPYTFTPDAAGRERAESYIRELIKGLGATLPAGAVAVTDSVAEAVRQAGTERAGVDPAEAAQGAADVAGPEVADEFSPAAIRDICRRAAYDMGSRERNVPAAILPTIAREAARRMQAEVAGQAAAARSVPGHVAGMDVLAALPGKTDWVMDYSGRDFRHRSGASFTLTKDDETLTIHFCRPVPSAVEIIHLDRPTTTAARVAAIITALTVQD